MNFREFLQTNVVILDGGMGTLLTERGLASGEKPEVWNLTHPDVIEEIQLAYFMAGSNVVNTNTFGANRLKYEEGELEDIISSAIAIAKRARARSGCPRDKYIALDIGPTGKLLSPLGDLDFEEAVTIFSEVVRLGVKYGVDLITIETMNDAYETKAALLAARECSELPVIVTNSYGSDGKLMTGADPSAMTALLEGMGADAIGVNCTDPDTLSRVVKEMLAVSSTPVVAKPNAGIPRLEGGKTVFDLSEDGFAAAVSSLVSLGVRAVGGCCGTAPAHIEELAGRVKDTKPKEVSDRNLTVISSYTHAVTFSERPILIGERINPTGKPKLKEAIRTLDLSYILTEGINEADSGADVLDVNAGLPDVNEAAILPKLTRELQAILDTPLSIDTSNQEALEAAMRIYNGKPLINSVSGKAESMAAVFPLLKKYGGAVIALTLDEDGIPDTAYGRVKIAKKILAEAAKYGISKKDIIFDPLTLTVSTDTNAANTTLKAVELIKKELGCHTSLGVSNVSFGLPLRDVMNAFFFTSALSRGLSAAIMNPLSLPMMNAYYTYLAIAGLDEGCRNYIGRVKAGELTSPGAPSVKSAGNEAAAQQKTGSDNRLSLADAIVRGLGARARELTRELLAEREPLDIINSEIIPALDKVGVGFESKKVYLPELLMSAEAASAAFDVIKSQKSDSSVSKKVKIVIATVKGDIHDIGKNIVKLLLENYGFTVSDLGRDVFPEKIVEKAKELCADIVGLSALMTTTAPAMAETAKLLKAELPTAKIMVGGAVINEDFAKSIGADYAKDAMSAVRYAEAVEKSINKK